jgi:flagella basal body P-ring formation protein FlgA
MKRLFLNRFGINVLWFTTVLVIFASASADEDPRPVIRMRSQAAVSDEAILLGKIAEIQCAQRSMKTSLEQLVVGRSPLPGQSRYIRVGHLIARMKQHDLNPDNLRILAAGPVKVTRVYNELDPEKIRTAVRAFIEAHAPWNAKQMKIRSIQCNQAFRLPPGKVDLNVSAPKHTDWLGAVPFSVNVSVNGKTVKKVSVPANIEVWSDVILAAKPLGRNQPVRRSDIRVEKMNLARVPADAVLDAEQVLGRRSNRAIAANSIIRNNQVVSPPVVRRGDVVQLLAESDHLKISTRGIAKEDGCPGERIRISNLRSRKIVYGQIIDARTARVEF